MMQQSCLVGQNQHVMRDGNSLYNKSFIDKGILTIRDILNDVAELLRWSQQTHQSCWN